MDPETVKIGVAIVVGWFLRDILGLAFSFLKTGGSKEWRVRAGNFFEGIILPCTLVAVIIYAMSITIAALHWFNRK